MSLAGRHVADKNSARAATAAPRIGMDQMQASRRAFVTTAAAAGVLAGAPSLAQAQGTNDAQLAALLNSFADEMLRASPETATSLGLDTGARADLKGKLSDVSRGSMVADQRSCYAMLRRMWAIDPASLSAPERIRYEAVQYALRLGAQGGDFHYGDNSFKSAMSEGSTPFVVSQQTGSLVSVPEFLNSQHKIETRADCESYLARLDAFARQLDQETERVRYDMSSGVIAPDFILDTTLTQARAMRATAAGDSSMVHSLVSRAADRHIDGDWSSRAERTVSGRVYPAIDRQIEALNEAADHAGHDAGVWKLPKGDDYYSWLLRVGTSTNLTADEIHDMGLEQGRAIDARMDEILRRQGMTHGSVGERMSAATRDPRFLKPNTDAGRAELIHYLEGRIAAVRPLLPRLSHMTLRAPVEVQRVPVNIQDGAG